MTEPELKAKINDLQHVNLTFCVCDGNKYHPMSKELSNYVKTLLIGEAQKEMMAQKKAAT
jgi:hypothetical protein